MPDVPSSKRLRRRAEARRVATAAYACRCCVVCGGEAVGILHLDRENDNIDASNLAFACDTHRVMFEAGLYPAQALRLMRDHWQGTLGQRSAPATPRRPIGVKRTLRRRLPVRSAQPAG